MILFISAVFPPEPVVSASISFDTATLLSSDHDVVVLTPSPSRPKGFDFKGTPDIIKTFRQVTLNSFVHPGSSIAGRTIESYSFGEKAAAYISENHKSIECIYVNSWPLLSQFLIVRKARQFKIPVITHVQDIYPEVLAGKLPLFSGLITRLLLPVDRYILRHSATVIAISSGMKKYLEITRKLEKDQVNVVYNWQDEERYLSFNRLNGKDESVKPFTFMFLGTLNRTASVGHIVTSFIKSGLDNARLVIAGSGPEKDNLKKLASSQAGAEVLFCEAPSGEVPALQSTADVLILNLKKGSAKFSLPSKLPAYMFSSKPVIACVDTGSDIAGLVRKADCGWVVPPGDPQALAGTMAEAVATAPGILKKLGLNGCEFAKVNFPKSRNCRSLAEIIAKYSGSERPQAG